MITRLSARPEDGLLRLAGGAAGNPLYVTELVAALACGSGLTITEGGAAELAGRLSAACLTLWSDSGR
jgi:hypothetical protein